MLLFNFILSCIMKFSYIVAKDSLMFNLCNITRPTCSGVSDHALGIYWPESPQPLEEGRGFVTPASLGQGSPLDFPVS